MSNKQLAQSAHLRQRRLFFDQPHEGDRGPGTLVSAPWSSPANDWPSLSRAFEQPRYVLGAGAILFRRSRVSGHDEGHVSRVVLVEQGAKRDRAAAEDRAKKKAACRGHEKDPRTPAR